jgi:hypothetical protein
LDGSLLTSRISVLEYAEDKELFNDYDHKILPPESWYLTDKTVIMVPRVYHPTMAFPIKREKHIMHMEPMVFDNLRSGPLATLAELNNIKDLMESSRWMVGSGEEIIPLHQKRVKRMLYTRQSISKATHQNSTRTPRSLANPSDNNHKLLREVAGQNETSLGGRLGSLNVVADGPRLCCGLYYSSETCLL